MRNGVRWLWSAIGCVGVVVVATVVTLWLGDRASGGDVRQSHTVNLVAVPNP